MYLKGAYLKYHGPKKKFLENYSGICNDKTINYRSLTLILGSAYLFLSVLFSSLCLSKNIPEIGNEFHLCSPSFVSSGFFCDIFTLAVLTGSIWAYTVLGLFFYKLCTVFAGKDQICVHKATVWSGLLH